MPRYGFSGEIAQSYDAGLGPVLFEPYALETAARVAELAPGPTWLELAAGTGRLTRHLLPILPERGTLRATDLQSDMLKIAQATLADPRLVFAPADATALPDAAESFDLVLSGFGVMFYPDRPAGHREARRVLRAGGAYVFTTWTDRGENPWADAAQRLLDETFPNDPPAFFRAPFSYGDEREIRSDLAAAGFADVRIERVAKPLLALNAAAFARGVVTGTPLAQGLAERGVDPEAFVTRTAETFAARFGDDPLRSETRALIVAAR